MRKRLYVLEYFYWNSFLENVIILAYYFIYCLLCKFFDRKIVCRMGEIFMMSKEQFLVIFYGKYILVFGILLWLCIHYCRKGFFRFSFEGMIECKLKKLLEQKKHFLEILFNILVLFLSSFLFFRALLPTAADLPYALKDEFTFFEGVVEEGSNIQSKSKWEAYNISIQNQKGTTIKLSLYGKNGIATGDVISAEYLPHSKAGVLLSCKKTNASAQKAEPWSEKINSISQSVRISIAVVWILLFGALLFFSRKQKYVNEYSEKENVILIQMPPILLRLISVFFWVCGIFGALGIFGFVTQAFQTGVDTIYALLISVCALLFGFLRLYCREKRILIKGAYMRIETLFQKVDFHRDDIVYRFTGENNENIIFYQNGKKLTFVDALYPGYQELLCWLEKEKEGDYK